MYLLPPDSAFEVPGLATAGPFAVLSRWQQHTLSCVPLTFPVVLLQRLQSGGTGAAHLSAP